MLKCGKRRNVEKVLLRSRERKWINFLENPLKQHDVIIKNNEFSVRIFPIVCDNILPIAPAHPFATVYDSNKQFRTLNLCVRNVRSRSNVFSRTQQHVVEAHTSGLVIDISTTPPRAKNENGNLQCMTEVARRKSKLITLSYAKERKCELLRDTQEAFFLL